jgi:tetratricopeptide (TPR) repeat protein
MHIRWIAGIIACLILSGLATPYAWRAFKAYRSDSIAASVLREYLSPASDTSKLSDWVQRGRSAWWLGPERWHSNRSMGYLLSLHAPAQAVDFWEKALSSHPEKANSDDWLAYVQVLLILNRGEDAQAIIEQHGLQSDRSGAYNLSKALLLQGKTTEALHWARIAAHYPEPELRHLHHHAGLALHFGDAETKDGAIRLLKEGLESQLEASHTLLSDVIGLQELPLPVRKRAAALLLQQEIPLADRLPAATVMAQTSIMPEETLWEWLLSACDREDAAAVAALGRWMLQQGRPAQTLDLIPERLASGNRDLFLLHLQALYHSGERDRVRLLLQRADVPLPDQWKHWILSQTLKEAGETDAARSSWLRAARDAPHNPDLSWALVQGCGGLGLEERANSMLLDLVIRGQEEKVRLFLVKRFTQDGDLARYVASLKSLSQQFRNSPEWTNDWAWHTLLLGRDREEALEAIEHQLSLHPGKLALHMTWALDSVKRQDPRPVLERLRHFKVDWESMPPRWRWILAVALMQVGEEQQARHYAKGISAASLTPEEQLLAPEILNPTS